MSTFSYSGLAAYDSCPRKYAFIYRERVPKPATTSVEAFLGNRVHETFEWLYRKAALGDAPTAEATVARFHELWDAAAAESAPTVVRAGMELSDYRAMGARMVADHHAANAPFDDGDTIGLEMRFDIALDATGDHRLMGFIDRVVRVAPGSWEIHDYKTSESPGGQQEADTDRQLALYELALRAMFPGEIERVELVWRYVRTGIDVRSRRTPEQLDELRAETIARIDAAERATVFPTRTSALCDWCEYRGICPAFRHAADLADGTDADRRARDLEALVEEYALLDAEIETSKARLAGIGATIIDLADAAGYDRAQGRTCSVRIWRPDGVSMPPWSDPRRAEIARIVREAGLWDEHSTLDATGLAKAMGRGDLPEQVAARIMEHTVPGTPRLYVNRRR
jgi:putative RecB family exonuclease